jgi:two-component system, NtrC family, sensor histidine kinase KinB
MRLSLRWHIALTLVPLLLLLVTLGGAGAVLLYRLGGRIDTILSENYRSVRYMELLNEALERIDSSFVFALLGREEQARQQYEKYWQQFQNNLRLEQENITVPGEAEWVAELTRLAESYRRHGDAFYALPPNSPERHQYYFPDDKRPGVLYQTFDQIKQVAGEILRINQVNMEQASDEARATAVNSFVSFGLGLALVTVLAVLLAWRTTRTILQPIRDVTHSALGISAGNLDQVVPVLSRDELGQLAEAFNVMARHLRDYRQSQYAQLLRAQRTSQATIDSFPDPVLVIDAEGHVEMANPAARRLLGVAPKQPGELAPQMWHAPEPLRRPLAEALQGKQDYLPEGFDKVVPLGTDHHERVVLPRILTIRDPYGNLLGAAVLLQDVTRLRLLDQVKSNLVATASHELKTPLTSIRLAVHLLLEEAAGPLTDKQTELLVDARENCERLLAVVNNLLDLARLEQGRRQLEVRPESPAELLREAAEAIRPRAADKGVEVAVDVPPELPAVAVDASRIGIALRNLLENALTYTDAGGRITLAAAAGPDAVLLSVADTGAGIPPEHLPHVFEKFFRVPGQSQASGTGLGLAVVHEIVTAHGGTITCESQPGVGTTFRLTLPVAAGSPTPETVFGRADGESPR